MYPLLLKRRNNMTDRNYTGEYANYQGTPAQRKRNDARKAARRKMVAAGKVKRNDGKDVDHKNGNPKDNSTKNLRVTTKRTNRSFPRTSTSKKA
jgi:hypothetical protein